MTTIPDSGGVVPATAEHIRRAAERVRAGELVIVPTETVYGVAVRADWPEAMARLFAAKGRDEGKPVAFFAENIEAVRASGIFVNAVAERLAAAFWPGPLTMVLQHPAGGWDGFRVPDHPVALAWVARSGPAGGGGVGPGAGTVACGDQRQPERRACGPDGAGSLGGAGAACGAGAGWGACRAGAGQHGGEGAGERNRFVEGRPHSPGGSGRGGGMRRAR